jgi:ParB family chromosome partitioning protein
MARRRLAPPADRPAAAEEGAARRKAPAGVLEPGPPIAFAAGEAARAGAETARAARELAEAKAEGRILIDVPLEAVEDGRLPRDRAPDAVPAEETHALMASLREHGQRTPAEVAPLRTGRYGLVSGWRRLAALRALHAETGDPRFGVLRAILRTDIADGQGPAAFVSMVEENEIRLGLTPYERGRIAVLAAEQGAFRSVEAAVDVLFAAGSKAKRSKIRRFAELHRALGDVLRHPTHLSERLGLRTAEALKAGPSAIRRLRGTLSAADPSRSPEAEAETLSRTLDAMLNPGPKPGVSRAKPGRPRRAVVAERRLGPGLTLTELREGDRVLFQLSGEAAGDERVLERMRAALEAAGQEG